jgi:hypothetical protein
VRRRRRRIWLAKVSRINRDPNQLALVHEEFGPDIAHALDPEVRHQYYGRVWRLSQPYTEPDTLALYCKLGFARRARGEEVDYDEAEHDWVTVEAPANTGDYSHFVINLNTQILAFEEKGTDLSRESFLNALSLFLSTAGYEINLLSDSAGFEAWLDDVDQVTRFYVSLKPPNPKWTPRAKETRRIAQEIDAERLSIEAISERGLNVRDTVLDGAAETAAHGNGVFRASGFKAGARRFFDSAKRFRGGDIEVTDLDSSRTILNKMRDLMGELEPPSEGAPDSNSRTGSE